MPATPSSQTSAVRQGRKLVPSLSYGYGVAIHSERPNRFDELEGMRDELRASGRYREAGQIQQQLEDMKRQEEDRRMVELAEKHAQDLLDLEETQSREYLAWRDKWDFQMREVVNYIEQQQLLLSQRHAEERTEFSRRWAESQMRVKYSRSLLNLRVQEEHLIRQRSFAKAAQIKTVADEMEEREYEQQAAAWHSKQEMEETKMLQRQAREAEALKRKLQASHDESVIAQEKDLDKLTKTFKAARVAMQRAQGQERLVLEQALKGWMNPRKFGLPPPPLLIPGAGKVSPGQKVHLERQRRPETAPEKLQSISSPTASTTAGASTVDWPDSPSSDGVAHIRAQRQRSFESPSSVASAHTAAALQLHSAAGGGGAPAINPALLPREHGTAVGIASLTSARGAAHSSAPDAPTGHDRGPVTLASGSPGGTSGKSFANLNLRQEAQGAASPSSRASAYTTSHDGTLIQSSGNSSLRPASGSFIKLY